MDSISAFQKKYPKYNEFTADQIGELEEFAVFENGFYAGRADYPGKIVQVASDTWYQFNGRTWFEMSVEEQIEWSSQN